MHAREFKAKSKLKHDHINAKPFLPYQLACSSPDISTGATFHVPAELFLRTRRAAQFTGATHRRRENRLRRGDCEEELSFSRLGLVSFASSPIADRKIAVRSFILYVSPRLAPSMNHRYQLVSSMIHSRDTWRCLFSTSQRYLTFTPYSFYNLPQFASIQ